MKKMLWANILVALAFAAAPHFPGIQQALSFEDSSAAYGWLITVGSLLYAFGSTALLLIADHERRALTHLRETLDARLAAPVIAPRRDDEFYPSFLRQVDQAKASVLICYFGSHNPAHAQQQERANYYEDVLQAVRRRPRVAFRRLLRNTPANQEWACGRLADWVGLPNMSVALLDDLPPDHDMPLALSVQVVDEEITWLVAVEGHDRIGPYRDIEIKDAVFAQFMTKYYNRLWREAIKIVDAGNLTEDGIRFQTRCEGER